MGEIRLTDKLAIDVINGGPGLREWVDDPTTQAGDLETLTASDEAAWRRASTDFFLY